MPDHTPEHMARLSKESAAKRRTDKIARLIESSPVLSAEQASRLNGLISARVASVRRS